MLICYQLQWTTSETPLWQHIYWKKR